MKNFYFLAMICLSFVAFVGCSKKEEKKDLFVFVEQGTKVEIYKNLHDAFLNKDMVASQQAVDDKGLIFDIPYGKYIIAAENGCKTNALDIAKGRGVIDYNAENRSYTPILFDDSIVVVKNKRNKSVSVFAENAYPLDGKKSVVLEPNDEWIVVLNGYAGIITVEGLPEVLIGKRCSVEKHEIK